MRLVYGIGDNKLRDFGQTFLTILTDYSRQHRLAFDQAASPSKQTEASRTNEFKLTVRHERIFDLFRQQFRGDVRANRFTLDFALSGEEALGKVAHTEDADLILILSDVNMPGMSGIEFLPRSRKARPDVPVIMITAYGDPETRRKAIEAGAAGLFTKPIDFPELRGEIGRRLDAAMGAR